MKRVNKEDKKRNLDIEFIYKDRIEIDKDLKIYVYLNFSELNETV